MTQYILTINDQLFDVEVGAIEGGMAHVTVNQTPYRVKIDGVGRPTTPLSLPVAMRPSAAPVEIVAAPTSAARAVVGAGVIAAPIPGKMLHIEVRVGDRVKNGQTVAVMEAMKMENNILAPMDGTVKEIRTAVGTDVATGDVIMVIG
ncbi:MAG: acetyl-CoA carboxylase biotin carboxyl carrier protein subunit [Desulfatitalea sp.]|nr:acetyl-CoA carboxylase biotin carboxyl carrier protein subunit [Desulfatitalea sp.]MBI5895803.1 acetyl-CoA carboxylase biotin carboxyl carrier protein subunit [Desulfobacterales bacterium]